MCSELDRARVARDDTMHFDDKTTDWLGNHQNFLGTAAAPWARVDKNVKKPQS